MTIQYASDLHLEFPQNSAWLQTYPLKPAADILILAGDVTYLSERRLANPILDTLSAQYDTIYVVPGNHEFYVWSYDVNDTFPFLKWPIRKNIFYLNNQVIRHGTVRMLFTTLFTRIERHEFIDKKLTDFHTCKHRGERFTTHKYNECHELSLQFLIAELEKPFNGQTLIISHHAPYPPSFCDYPFSGELNEAFHVDMTWLFTKYKIDHWIHGHTHHNQKPFKIGDTWFYTNQLGYTFREEEKLFSRDAVLKLV